MPTMNESTIDRALRMIVGIALLALVFVGPRTPWGLLGVIPVATALVGVCPLYRLLGVSTCSTPSKRGV